MSVRRVRIFGLEIWLRRRARSSREGSTCTTTHTTEGLVAEVLVYDRALNVTERTAVEAALRTRYAIP